MNDANKAQQGLSEKDLSESMSDRDVDFDSTGCSSDRDISTGSSKVGDSGSSSSDVLSSDRADLDATNTDAGNSNNLKEEQVSDNEEINQLREKNAQLEAACAEAQDKYLRALADFENYKRRALKERSEMLKYQGEKILADLLGVVDTLERALEYRNADSEALFQGIELTYKVALDTFAKWDIKPVKGLGQKFDPNKFDALGKVVSADAVPGTIVSEHRKAYTYKDKLLRCGEVVVAVEPEGRDQAGSTTQKASEDSEDSDSNDNSQQDGDSSKDSSEANSLADLKFQRN